MPENQSGRGQEPSSRPGVVRAPAPRGAEPTGRAVGPGRRGGGAAARRAGGTPVQVAAVAAVLVGRRRPRWPA